MSYLEWSTTAINNDDADANINWTEGQAPSTVNNSARAEMAAMASFFQGIGGALTTAGTGSAYTLTLADAPTAYTTSMLLLVKFHAVSASTTATINVNGLGAKALKLWDGTALPSASHIPVNAYGLVKYDGTSMRVFLPSITAVTTQANTFATGQKIGDGTGSAQINLNGVSGSVSDLKLQAGGVDRWVLRRNATAESVGNAGSNLELVSYDDAGTLLASIFTVVRSTGVLNFSVAPTILGTAVPRLDATNTWSTTNEFGTFSTTGATSGKHIAVSTAIESSSRTATTATNHYAFYNPNGLVGTIQTSGTSTSYNTTSDAELKTEVTTADKAAAIAKVKAGRPVEFEFKGAPGAKHFGFIAQEMHLVHPEAVTPGDESTPWMMDHSKLVPVLWATVQDLLARVEALENA